MPRPGRGGAVDGEHLGPDRVAGDDGPGQRRAGERRRRAALAKRAARRLAAPGWVFCSATTIGTRHSTAASDARATTRSRRAPTTTARPEPAHEADRRATRPAGCPTTAPTLAEREPALDAPPGQQRVRRCPVGGHEPGLDAPLGADVVHGAAPRRSSASAMASPGSTWPGGPAAGDDGVDTACASVAGGCAADVAEDAGRRHVGQHRRAAEADERQRHAGDRQDADDRADVHEAPARRTTW